MLTYDVWASIKVTENEQVVSESGGLNLFVSAFGKDLIANFAGCDLNRNCYLGIGGATYNFPTILTFSKNGFIVTASDTYFTSDMVGLSLLLSDGNSLVINKVLNSREVIVDDHIINFTDLSGGVIGACDKNGLYDPTIKLIAAGTVNTFNVEKIGSNLVICHKRTFSITVPNGYAPMGLTEIGCSPIDNQLFGYRWLATPITVAANQTITINIVIVRTVAGDTIPADPFFKCGASWDLTDVILNHTGFYTIPEGSGYREFTTTILPFLEPSCETLQVSFYNTTDTINRSFTDVVAYESGTCERKWVIATKPTDYIFGTKRIVISNGEGPGVSQIVFESSKIFDYKYNRNVEFKLVWDTNKITSDVWFGTEPDVVYDPFNVA